MFCTGSLGIHARVAEWQTRRLQVPVPARAWRFNSSLAHVSNPERQGSSGIILRLMHGFSASGKSRPPIVVAIAF